MKDLEKLANELIEKESYDKDVDTSSGYSEIPDGVYNVKIEKVEIRTSKAGNKGLSITVRHDNNRISFINWYFSEKTQMRSLKRCMTLVKELGYEVNAELFSDENIEETMKSLIGEDVVYTKETNGEYVNQSLHAN